jgi:hypothetical protein
VEVSDTFHSLADQRRSTVSQGHTDSFRNGAPLRRETPWRRGLLLTLRERLEKETYVVPSDEVAASIIDRAMHRGREASG